ncbi:hypothetical protein [Streptomyces sp. WM6386]|nr:hypothetical protein [Streptomyces sp. WM6386]
MTARDKLTAVGVDPDAAPAAVSAARTVADSVLGYVLLIAERTAG